MDPIPAPAFNGPDAPATPDQQDTDLTPEELARRAESAQKARREIEALDRELGEASEAYNLARIQLERVQDRLERIRVRLRDRKATRDRRLDQFVERINAIYKEGDTQVLEVLLNTQELTDFLFRVHFLVTLTRQDADLIKKLKVETARIASDETKAKTLRKEQLKKTEELDQKRTSIEMKLAERGLYIQSLDANIRELFEEERRQISLENQALVEKILANDGSVDIPGRPGSVVHTALHYLGIPYLWGGSNPSIGMDCSGFTMRVFERHGVKIPHYSRSQYAVGTRIAMAELIPGDLVYFGNPIGHVGMYIGAGYFIHSPRTGDFVKISRLPGYPTGFVGATRHPLVNRY